MKSIPKSFRLFATTIDVKFDNELCNKKENYGESCYSKSEILLAKTNGIEQLSEDRIMDTFYHEKVHMVLDAMHKYDLSKDEEFVDIFAKLLRQADETQEY